MQVRKARSWYGSWPRVPKTSASTQLARETIFGGTSKPSSTPDFRRFDTKKSIDSASFDGPADSSASLPQIPEDGAATPEGDATIKKDGGSAAKAQAPSTETSKAVEGIPAKVDDTSKAIEEPQAQGVEPPAAASSWFGWLARAPVTETQSFTPVEETPKEADPLPEPESQQAPPAETPSAEAPAENAGPNPPSSTNSWFGFWYSNAPATENPPDSDTPKPTESTEMPKEPEEPAKQPEDVVMEDAPPPKPEPAKTPSAGSTWAFWSRDTRPKAEGSKSQTAQPESGELAIIGQGSEAQPEHTGISVEQAQSDQATKDGKNAKSSKDAKSSKSTKAGTASAPSTIGRKTMYLRPMVGQPTGTSLRFANLGAEAIRRWTDAHGCPDCEIEKVALEGDGKIADRVDNLWKLLLNWIEHIRNADLILVASHSQGVPVGVMLLAKLIDLGIITNAKIGVCAMAGVSLGPFPDYKSSMGILMGAANELWEFSNPDSEISKRYEHSLKEVLKYGARITYIGSIDDQLVPMESAIYSPASHPYIYRAVFIDGRIHAPDFIAHLVGFALKLRNLGVSDHGLIRELSTPLAGSLYSGEGHSRLYYDDQVYDLALTHALETSDVRPNVPATVAHRRDSTGAGTGASVANPNPYHLPWIMRGLLEEDFVRTELSSETEELLRQFDDWKPVTKALKDVKYRLEAIRSKL
ncbi:hypothetical protein CLIM01_08725 [Colletotrichum limetticola]|uniref:YMC020W-like alpha/beta hydrolase domain-containing protein n=1 Tax=Colletotrichum limetticola TaxID=1209924 RepID=A0ABQ9PQV6_9PEZI|nr:hypothetical protein CLIM01_08725 [Colletotrichum limetticola]